MTIMLGIDVNGGEIVFYDGENMNDIGKKSTFTEAFTWKVCRWFF